MCLCLHPRLWVAVYVWGGYPCLGSCVHVGACVCVGVCVRVGASVCVERQWKSGKTPGLLSWWLSPLLSGEHSRLGSG